MTRPVVITLLALGIAAPAAAQFSYRPAGELVPGSGSGRVDSTTYVPDMRFPMEEGPAYANSQVYGAGGGMGPGGGQCDRSNYSYPWRDNYCETRNRSSYSMPMCPDTRGQHQGQDIRPATCANSTYWVVAATDGTITQVGSYSVYLTDATGRRFDYLHMSNVQVSRGQRVRCGDRLGMVSNRFGGTPTTIHLHFNTLLAVRGYAGQVFAPPYMSLVSAYQRLNRCGDPPPLCDEASTRDGRTCTALGDREVCIGSVAVTEEGCSSGRGRTCSCVSDGSGGARWDCPSTATCRVVDECDACGGRVSGGGSSGGTTGTNTCMASPYEGPTGPAGVLLAVGVAAFLRRRRRRG